MTGDFEFGKSTGRCAATGRPLAEGESYYAVLFARPEGLERLDYSEQGWPGPPDGHFCFWRARVPIREKTTRAIPISHELLTSLFQRLEEADSVMKQQFRFVLALLLLRKRLLKFEQTVRDQDQEYWQLRLVSDQSVHQVLNPRLTEAEVERLSGQLTAILSGDATTLNFMEDAESAEEASTSAASPGEHDAAGL